MRTRLGLMVLCAIALTVPVLASGGSPNDRATGGGQILVSNKGAGSTIAFTARGAGSAAEGQVQFIDRSAGTGQSQVKYHGTVTCIAVEGSMAKIAGVLTNGDSFNLYVEDTGEGHGNADPIFFDGMADTPDCSFDTPDDSDLMALARGNVQIHDADG